MEKFPWNATEVAIAFPPPPAPAVVYIAFSNRTIFYKKFLYIKIIW